ncbi:hypothetical protein M0R45_018178 [Rubus argutus]|uniref:TMV resistance protein N-like n=1 Tax=Rubus argutus TaxID=59490 RepID=A0AAW1X3F2_RUBAR
MEKLYEAEFINKIIGELSARVVNPSQKLHVADNPIGIESCRQEINRLLDVEENVVRMVGIWGTGGIGKTTIAKDVYNSIRHKFEGSCFLEVVGTNSSPYQSLAKLQETLLFDILGDSNLKVSSDAIGVSFIKERMRQKKVLLILDDVSESNQLKKLAPSSDCFGAGSRIIITTRDQHSLTAHGVGLIYEVKVLDDHRALELFSWHAFKCNEPPGEFSESALRAVDYAKGLPLALIVLGSHLIGRSKDQWEATLDSCSGFSQIRDILKISYSALGEDYLKELFLDIACFFKGAKVNQVTPILQACGRNPKIGMQLLEEKALIRIDEDKIWMHDLIEEMGKDIVIQEGEPGKRSRLWNFDDINHVLTNNTGTDKIKGIQIAWERVAWEWEREPDEICLNATSFSVLKNLVYFSDRMGVVLGYSGNIDYLSNKLRWLDWHGCPLQSFPSNFHPKELVWLNIDSAIITRLWEGRKIFPNLTSMILTGCRSLLELPDLTGIPYLKELTLEGCTSLVELGCPLQLFPSNFHPKELVLLQIYRSSITRLWKGRKICPNLTSMILAECESLLELPDFTGIPNLKELTLNRCKSLVEVHDSVGSLHRLETLNTSGCSKLVKLPREISLKSVQTINLSHCRRLKEFPKIIGKMDSLRTLNLLDSGIKELHPSIGNLIGLKVLLFWSCKNLTTLPCSIDRLQNLENLDLCGCSKLATFLEINRKMDSLRKLRLAFSGIKELHPSIGNLIGLKDLDLSYCKNLTTLPCSIDRWQNLETLDLKECTKLATSPEINRKMDSLRYLNLSCSGIKELHPSIGNLIGLKHLSLRGCKKLTTLPCSIYGLQNLETLDLSQCSKLVTFPTNTKSLHEDNGDGSLWLPKLKVLRMEGCNSYFLTTLDCLETLTELDLSSNSFVSLPACISKFVNLEKLDLSCCERLREIPELPPNLLEVDVSDCESLEKFWKLSKVLEGKELLGIKVIILLNCNRLCDNLGYNMDKMKHILLNNQDNAPFRVVFPGRTSEVPKWFNCWMDVIGPTCEEDVIGSTSEEDVIGPTGEPFDCEFSIKISENLKWEKIGLAICAVSEGAKPCYCDYAVSINEVCIRPSGTFRFARRKGVRSISTTDHVWLDYFPLPVERMAKVDDQKGCSSPQPYYMCRVRFTHPYADKFLKGCGVHLVCQESKDDEYSSNKVGGGGVEPTEQKRHRTDLLESENPQQKKHRGPNSM